MTILSILLVQSKDQGKIRIWKNKALLNFVIIFSKILNLRVLTCFYALGGSAIYSVGKWKVKKKIGSHFVILFV